MLENWWPEVGPLDSGGELVASDRELMVTGGQCIENWWPETEN